MLTPTPSGRDCGLRDLAGLAIVAALVVAPVSPAASAPEVLSVRSIVGGPSPLDAFRAPAALAADATRAVFIVADTGNRRLALFDASGRARGTIALDRPAPPGAGEPRAVAVDRRGRIYVVDGVTRQIEVLTSTGSRIALVPLPPVAGDRAQAQAIAVGRSGRLYLVYGGDRPGLLAMEPSGEARLTLGFAPAGSGPFAAPVSIAVTEDETEIAVVDPEGDRAVLIFGADGTRRAAFGLHGNGEGTFSLPVHVAWGPGKSLWIVDTIRHSISIFDARGTCLGRVGGFGAGPGQFNYPAASAFLAPDRLVVLERAGNRCQVLEIAMEESGTPLAASQPAAPDGEEPVTTKGR
jgi:DNA-binding beta-propeller fold protein YncE